MWLFTKVGFFSAVESDKGDGKLSIRARVAGDLELLREKYLPELSATVQLPGRDYPYRGFVTKEAFAEGVKRAALDIDYGNFKSKVAQVQGHARAHLYSDVWGVMYKADEKLGGGKKTAKRSA